MVSVPSARPPRKDSDRPSSIWWPVRGSDYVVTLVLGAGRTVTLPLLLGASASGSGSDPTVAALALLAILPPLLLLLAVSLTRRKDHS
ncbi:MAG: hypothetical protein ACQERF_04965 [Actinomycetota bacterium]